MKPDKRLEDLEKRHEGAHTSENLRLHPGQRLKIERPESIQEKLKSNKVRPKPTFKLALADIGETKEPVYDPTVEIDELEDDDDDDMEDVASAMAADLKAALETASDDEDDQDGLPKDTAIDYNLIKNFLQSFKAQGGLSGPVSNLAGRLGAGVLPRDS